jgi:hypothetical protein
MPCICVPFSAPLCKQKLNGEIIKKDVNSRLDHLVDETLGLARKVSND